MQTTVSAPSKDSNKPRLVVFGSFYRGFFVLSELLQGHIAHEITVVGVATDDPSKSFVSPHKRVWLHAPDFCDCWAIAFVYKA